MSNSFHSQQSLGCVRHERCKSFTEALSRLSDRLCHFRSLVLCLLIGMHMPPGSKRWGTRSGPQTDLTPISLLSLCIPNTSHRSSELATGYRNFVTVTVTPHVQQLCGGGGGGEGGGGGGGGGGRVLWLHASPLAIVYFSSGS